MAQCAQAALHAAVVIVAAQSQTLGHLPSKNTQLMSENKNFGLEPSSRFKPRCDEVDQQANKVKHRLVGYPEDPGCLRCP